MRRLVGWVSLLAAVVLLAVAMLREPVIAPYLLAGMVLLMLALVLLIPGDVLADHPEESGGGRYVRNRALATAREMREWQQANPDRVKVPD